MKRKLKYRYYCDHCKKSSGSASHIKTHEKHCTMNPDRKCRMCKEMEEIQQETKSLLELLPDSEKFKNEVEECLNFLKFEEECNLALKKLREKTNNCPMCILATIRQSGIPSRFFSDFKFNEEKEKIWGDINFNSSNEYPSYC